MQFPWVYSYIRWCFNIQYRHSCWFYYAEYKVFYWINHWIYQIKRTYHFLLALIIIRNNLQWKKKHLFLFPCGILSYCISVCKCSNSFYIVLVTAENLDFDITNGFWMSMSAIYNYQLSGLANLKLNKRPSIIRLDDSLHRWSIDQFM